MTKDLGYGKGGTKVGKKTTTCRGSSTDDYVPTVDPQFDRPVSSKTVKRRPISRGLFVVVVVYLFCSSYTFSLRLK